MNRKKILTFISENDNELLLNFYDKTFNKLIELNKRIDRLTGQLIIVVFLYLITSESVIKSFQIGPIEITDITIFIKLLPVLFSYLLFDIIITAGHKIDVFMTVKLISISLYKQDVLHKELESNRHGLFTRILLPFSYSIELSKLSSEKPNIIEAIFGFIIFLPLLLIIFLPFFFEYYMLKEVFLHYFNDLLGKISFYLTIWIIALTLFYIIKHVFSSYKDQKEELN